MDPCSMRIERGPCDASIPSYGYDGDLGICVKFMYGGCEGNHNRFGTLEECQETCRNGGIGFRS